MSVSLVDVAGANFVTEKNSDDTNTKFMSRLGLSKRYLPARLAIARSLAVSAEPEPLSNNFATGKAIKGDTLFGTGVALSTWISLVIEYSGLPDIDTKILRNIIGAHWKRGLDLLDKDWMKEEEDISRFINRLAEVAEIRNNGDLYTEEYTTDGGQTFIAGEIIIPIGEKSEDTTSKEILRWNVNGRGGSPHSALMGGVGSGKTRTAVSMLKAIREQVEVPILAFDFKGDLGTNAKGGGYQIDKVFNAEILEPPRTPIPLDVLSIQSRDKIDIAEAASRFRESFARLKSSRLGELQRTAIHKAATWALDNEIPCKLQHIFEAINFIYDEEKMKEDGAIATMQEICRFPLFQPVHNPASFFKKSWIIHLPPNVAEDNRMIVVNLILDALNQHLNSLTDAEINKNGAREIRIICMIDEAHQILGTKLPALSSLIRMSRSKGGAIMLISQSPDDFSGVDDEFLNEMGLVAAFQTHASSRNVVNILGKGTNLSALQNGQCFLKRRGDQSSKKIKAW